MINNEDKVTHVVCDVGETNGTVVLVKSLVDSSKDAPKKNCI